MRSLAGMRLSVAMALLAASTPGPKATTHVIRARDEWSPEPYTAVAQTPQHRARDAFHSRPRREKRGKR